ncbi:zinc finger protein ZFMSA12A-like isoform X1 [Scylla paramamosain]|uniref:zinc finger protein ZFMSA12A-like isoform X1 n=2 Tax=Scylla paramamosain TaxID=85552 RepID=UPI003083BAEE
MGPFGNFDGLCRLCGLQCYDLINLFEDASRQRNLIAIIKKYIRINVALQDSLPHHVCGPCLAKLDEVVDFVDMSQATQSKLNSQLRECTTESSVEVNEDKLYELIQDVKVELEESESQFIDDLNDEDYGSHTNRRQRRKATRGVRGQGVISRAGASGKQARKVRSKDATQGVANTKNQTPENIAPANTQMKEKWMDSHPRKEVAAETCVEGSMQEPANPLSSCDRLSNSVKNTVRCSLCKSSFSQVDHLTSHSLEAHQLSDPSYLCPQCPQIFNKISSLKNHQRRKHQDSLQTCPQCNKLYPTHYLWTRHMLVHTNSRPFSCDKCEKKFKSKAELINHKRIHRPSEERYTHCCEVCGKRFTQKANLESHLRLHSGNRPFSCEFCGKCFSQRGNMEEHRRIHTGEKPFVCDVCGVSYSRQGQLAMHRRQHSGEKPHKCQYCEKEFLRREVLKKHEHMHTDTRPYKCSYCEKSFRDQGKRKVHERLHTGERPFECQFCGRGFCESGNLRKHLRVHQRRPGSSASSSIQDKDQESIPVNSRPPEVSCGDSSFHFNPAQNPAFSVPGLTVSRHDADIAAVQNSAALTISQPIPLASANSHPSHPTHQPQENPAPPPLPLLGNVPLNSHSLTALHPVEDSQGSCTLPPHECDREDYRVASSYQPVTTWTLYHA